MLHSVYNYLNLASLFGSSSNSELLGIVVYLRFEICSLLGCIEEGLYMTQIIIAKHFKVIAILLAQLLDIPRRNLGIVLQHLIRAG